MGKHCIIVYLLCIQNVQGVPQHICQLNPFMINEATPQKTKISLQSDLFNVVQSALVAWLRSEKLLPKLFQKKFLKWPDFQTSIHMGSTSFPWVSEITKMLGLPHPLIFSAFAVQTNLITTYCVDGQFMDETLVTRLFAKTCSEAGIVTAPTGISSKGVYILRLLPADQTRFQRLEWQPYLSKDVEEHLTLATSTGRFLNTAAQLKELIGYIYAKARQFSQAITWKEIPEALKERQQTWSSFEWYIGCTFKTNEEQSCDPGTITGFEDVAKLINELKRFKIQSTDLVNGQMIQSLDILDSLRAGHKTNFRSFGSYAAVIASWQDYILKDPDSREIQHIVDTSMDYSQWAKNFHVMDTVPHRIVHNFEVNKAPVMTKVDGSNPNVGNTDKFEEIVFLDHSFKLQQFWSFLAQRRTNAYNELGNLRSGLLFGYHRLQQQLQSLTDQMVSGQNCTQTPQKVKCIVGPIKMWGSVDKIEIRGLQVSTKNKTYFAPVCNPLESENGDFFSNFIWDGELFERSRGHLTNSQHRMPMGCLTLSAGKIKEECEIYFPQEKHPRSIFLVGNMLVHIDESKDHFCFTPMSDDGLIFDKDNKYVTVKNTTCINRVRFPIFLHDKKYTFTELRNLILNRLQLDLQSKLHKNKWRLGASLTDTRLEVRKAYRTVRDFFSDTLHIWLITGFCLSILSVVYVSMVHWRHRRLKGKRECQESNCTTEPTSTQQPLMGIREIQAIDYTSPFINRRDIETDVIIRGSPM